MSYILQFVYSARFMTSSLSNLVNNIFEGIHRTKFKYGHEDENVKLVELNINVVSVFLNIKILGMI